MNPSTVLLHIAEQRLQYWQHQLQAAFRTGNAEQALVSELLISEYEILIREAGAAIRSQAAAFLHIDCMKAPPRAALQDPACAR